MANIFISYSRESEAIARTLVDDIETLGHTVWFDHALSGGQPWWDQILATVRDCTVFAFVLDLAALNSTACNREYAYAADLGKPILPILVSEGVRENLLPPALSKVQFVDYRKQDRDAALRLARALATVPPPRPLRDPLPTPPEAPISYLGSLVELAETTIPLSYEDQSGLLIKLKRSLRDPPTTEDSRMLLECLRKRNDLHAIVRDEIDELLASTTKAPPTPPRTSGVLADNMPPEGPAPQSSATEPARISTHHPPTALERVKGACIGASAEVLVLGFLMSYSGRYFPLVDLILFPLGGAIAGLISGMNWRRIVAALVGMGVEVLFIGFVSYYYLFPHPLWMLVSTAPLGALVGVYIERKMS